VTGVDELVIAGWTGRDEAALRMELEDPVRKRKLAHEYRIAALPVEG
jgi:hypothetical protein